MDQAVLQVAACFHSDSSKALVGVRNDEVLFVLDGIKELLLELGDVRLGFAMDEELFDDSAELV